MRSKRQFPSAMTSVPGSVLAILPLLPLLACGKGTTKLADIHPDSLTARMGTFSEWYAEVDFPGVGQEADSGCPVLGSSVTATVNQQEMEPVSLGGEVVCNITHPPQARCCSGIVFKLDNAWKAAKPDGTVQVSVEDGSQRIAMVASGALLPNAISLAPPASSSVSRGDVLTLDVAQREPPLANLTFRLVRPSGQDMMIEYQVSASPISKGAVDVRLPPGGDLAVYQLQARNDKTTSPTTASCEGVGTCLVNPTDLVGSVDLRFVN
jgi:hypothetical protein